MNEDTKNLLNVAKKMLGKQLITTEELSGFVSDVANLLAQYRSTTASINKETKDTLNTLVKAIDEAHSEIILKKKGEVEKYIDSSKEKLANEAKPFIANFTEEQKKDIEKLFKKHKKVLEEIKAQIPKDGKDGKDGEKGDRGEPGRDGKDGSQDTPDEIAEKINTLEEQIEIKTIKGYKNLFGKSKQILSGGAKLLSYLLDVNISSPTDGQALTYNATTSRWENGDVSGGVTVQDIDGTPTVSNVTAIKFTNGSVTDNGDGTVNVTTGSGGGGDVSSNTATSVDSEIAIFSGTGGKTIKRATTTGILKGTSGVISAATADTDYLTPSTAASTYQPLDSDLTTVSGLSPSNDDFIQRKAGAWANRTVAQVKTDLGLTGTNSGDQNLFSTIAVSGQSDVVADSTSDTLTLVAGSNVTITTNATSDTITIAASGGGGLSDGDYGDITVSGSGTVMNIDASTVGLTELSATGTPSSSTFLRGDNTWASLTYKGGIQFNLYRSSGLQVNDGFKTVVPFTGTITGWVIATKDGTSQTVTLNVSKATYSNVPTFTDIDGSEPITLSSATKNTDTSLSTWTTSVTEGDHIHISVASVTGTVTGVYGIINVDKTT